MAAAAMRQAGGPPARLFLFSLRGRSIDPALLEVMHRIAGAVGPWASVEALEFPEEMATPDREAVRALRDRIGGTADEIWVDSLWASFSKIAAEAHPKARIVLYEDGLHTYVPAEDNRISAGDLTSNPRRAWRIFRGRLHERRHPDDLTWAMMLPRHLARVAASYLWIGRKVPLPAHQRRLPRVPMDTRHVREVVDLAADVAPSPSPPSGHQPRALVLGQCFANYDDLDRDEEIAGYVEMADRLWRAGYEILWKEHPRSSIPAFPAVNRSVPGVSTLPELGPWPVELFVPRMGISACASVTSTSLFSIPELFGLPSYSPAARFLPNLRHPNDTMARLVMGCVPPLPGTPAVLQPA